MERLQTKFLGRDVLGNRLADRPDAGVARRGRVWVRVPHLHGARIGSLRYYAVFFLITGFFEDFLLRGYSQWVLARE